MKYEISHSFITFIFLISLHWNVLYFLDEKRKKINADIQINIDMFCIEKNYSRRIYNAMFLENAIRLVYRATVRNRGASVNVTRSVQKYDHDDNSSKIRDVNELENV